MKVLGAFIRNMFHYIAIYRLNFLLYTPAFFVMMYASYSVWSILYQQSPGAFGMDLERMKTYGVLGILLMHLMEAAMVTPYYINDQVRSGTLELDLLKPLDFMFHMFGRSFGALVVLTLTRVAPGLVFAVVFLDFAPPVSLQAGLSFLSSVILGFLVFFAVNFLIGLLSIVTLDIRSISWAFEALIKFTSGQFVPLWMFPPILRAIAMALPFQAVFFAPMSLYVGADVGDPIRVLLSQALWAIALLLAARLFWARVQRRITIQGG
jgi:ABC-2 type transport system permease protein